MKYILASTSPRRRELLKELLEEFEVISPNTEESNETIFSFEQLACTQAEEKCDAVFKSHPNSTVIAADTVVLFEGRLFGKPKGAADAERTLKMLSGKTHSVVTGVCVRSPFKKAVNFDRTLVKFNILSDEFIKNYVAGGSPLDKAGSYGIQDEGVVYGYNGSYSNVVGLPLELTRKLLEIVRNK